MNPHTTYMTRKRTQQHEHHDMCAGRQTGRLGQHVSIELWGKTAPFTPTPTPLTLINPNPSPGEVQLAPRFFLSLRGIYAAWASPIYWNSRFRGLLLFRCPLYWKQFHLLCELLLLGDILLFQSWRHRRIESNVQISAWTIEIWKLLQTPLKWTNTK